MSPILESLQSRLKGKVVIVGVGNPMRGDDGVGPHLISLLQGKTTAGLLDCGEVPENYLGKIAALEPDTVVVVDAADFQAEPGSLAIIEPEDFASTSFSTHNPSLEPFALFLKSETGADIFAVGIQPRSIGFDTEMSAEVRSAAELLAKVLSDDPQAEDPPVVRSQAHQLGDEGQRDVELSLATEKALAVYANGHMLARLRCTPTYLPQLVRGFLLSEGFVGKAGQIRSVSMDESGSRADADLDVPEESILQARESLSLATGCGGGVSRGEAGDVMDCDRPFDLSVRVDAETVLSLCSEFAKRSELYRETRCVHSAALVHGAGFVAFADDIGRHNAVDKVIGLWAETGERFSDKGLVTSGRVTLDIAAKAARMRLAYVASRCAATAEAVELAQQHHVAVLATVRRDRMTVHSAPWRVQADPT